MDDFVERHTSHSIYAQVGDPRYHKKTGCGIDIPVNWHGPTTGRRRVRSYADLKRKGYDDKEGMSSYDRLKPSSLNTFTDLRLSNREPIPSSAIVYYPDDYEYPEIINFYNKIKDNKGYRNRIIETWVYTGLQGPWFPGTMLDGLRWKYFNHIFRRVPDNMNLDRSNINMVRMEFERAMTAFMAYAQSVVAALTEMIEYQRDWRDSHEWEYDRNEYNFHVDMFPVPFTKKLKKSAAALEKERREEAARYVASDEFAGVNQERLAYEVIDLTGSDDEMDTSVQLPKKTITMGEYWQRVREEERAKKRIAKSKRKAEDVVPDLRPPVEESIVDDDEEIRPQKFRSVD